MNELQDRLSRMQAKCNDMYQEKKVKNELNNAQILNEELDQRIVD